MHTRRLAAFLLGCWFVGSLFMAFVATHNLRSVDHLLQSPPPEAKPILAQLGPQARPLLRHQAGELNRAYFRSWEVAQLIFGGSFAIALLPSRRHLKMPLMITGLMLMILLLQLTVLTPELIGQGRRLDFAANAPPDERKLFGLLHGLYSGAELLKLGLMVVTAVLLFRQSERLIRSRPSRELDVVNDPDYSHVDG
jgi:hypothetical protein